MIILLLLGLTLICLVFDASTRFGAFVFLVIGTVMMFLVCFVFWAGLQAYKRENDE